MKHNIIAVQVYYGTYQIDVELNTFTKDRNGRKQYITSQVHSLAGCVMMYIIGRVIGSFVSYISLSLKLDLYSVLSSILRVLSICLPRLDLFGKTSWLLYSDFTIGSIGLFLTQTLAFCGIFVFAAIIDLKKKEF